MSLKNGILGTVIGGTILTPIVWGLESIKDKLPNWLERAIDFVWAPIAIPRVIAWLVALAFGFLIVDFVITTLNRRKKPSESGNRPVVVPKIIATARPRDFDTMPAQNMAAVRRLDETDETILAALTRYTPHAQRANLMRDVRLTPIRFDHAIDGLKAKGLLRTNSSYTGSDIVYLTADGRAYVVAFNLDKR